MERDAYGRTSRRQADDDFESSFQAQSRSISSKTEIPRYDNPCERWRYAFRSKVFSFLNLEGKTNWYANEFKHATFTYKNLTTLFKFFEDNNDRIGYDCNNDLENIECYQLKEMNMKLLAKAIILWMEGGSYETVITREIPDLDLNAVEKACMIRYINYLQNTFVKK